MKKNTLLAVMAALFAGGAAAAPTQSERKADLIMTGGNIYTVDGQWAQSMAIGNGLILAVGDASAVAAYQGPATKVTDLHGRTVLPGFHDMHVHPLFAGHMLTSCVLKREATPVEIKATVKGCVAHRKKGEWITGGSWVNDVFKDEPQDRKLLDEAAPDNPVILSDETGHSSWVNTLALKIAGIDRNTANPLNGVTYEKATGPEPFTRFKPVRDTIDAGAIALEGSDWPVSPSSNPWIAVETLITRQKPGGGGDPLALNEAPTMKEAIDIYTVNAAKQFGHSDSVGSIAPGMVADVIVIDRNPFKVPVTTVHDTRVLATLINGEVVYQAPTG